MKAVILAGGKGSRLKPYTTEVPKPLLSLGEKSILERLIVGLKKSGVTDITLAVNHMAHLIQSVIGDGEKLGVKVSYSIEDKELSTVAPLKLIDNLDDNFLVCNGDILTDMDFKTLFEYHLSKDSLLTVATYRRNAFIDFGVIETDNDGVVNNFIEKPSHHLTVSCGIYVFSKKVLDFVPDDKPFGFDDLMFKLLLEKQKIHTFEFNGYWLDIGRPDDYKKALKDFKQLD